MGQQRGPANAYLNEILGQQRAQEVEQLIADTNMYGVDWNGKSARVGIFHEGQWRSPAMFKRLVGAGPDRRRVLRDPVFKYLRAKAALINAVRGFETFNKLRFRPDGTQRPDAAERTEYYLTGVPQTDQQRAQQTYRQAASFVRKVLNENRYNPQNTIQRINQNAVRVQQVANAVRNVRQARLNNPDPQALAANLAQGRAVWLPLFQPQPVN
jgi:hypothetical protein